jgi:glycerol-1-phosphate dehydrogenase [NAD(P)+]
MTRLPNLPLVHLQPFADVAERRPVLVVTSRPAWLAVHDALRGLNVAAIVEVSEATTAHWDALDAGRPSRFEGVYAVGGGLAADAAKYLAARHGLPLVMLPTALSVDAFITAASGIRRDGCVAYIETKVAETLILDLDTIAKAPPAVRAAGVTDVLSIATGNWDWRFAHDHGRNPAHMTFIPWVYAAAQAILSGALGCAEAAGRGDRDGLKTLYDCLALEVQLCNQIGHSRPEEGSEHYFAYAIENVLGHGLPHGDLVGPGIVQIARLQGQDTLRLERALTDCHVPLDRIAPPVIADTLQALPAYCARHQLAFGIAHTLGDTR